MAEPVQIKGSSYEGKVRNPLGVVALSIVTLGIYYLFWYFKANKEMAELGKAHGTEECGTSPGTSLAAIIPGFILIIPPYYSLYKACKRLNASERTAGAPEGIEAPLLWLVMVFLSPVGIYLFQRNLNRVLEAQASPESLAAGTAVPQPTVEAPEPTPPPAQ
jgi:hypothetical protein